MIAITWKSCHEERTRWHHAAPSATRICVIGEGARYPHFAQSVLPIVGAPAPSETTSVVAAITPAPSLAVPAPSIDTNHSSLWPDPRTPLDGCDDAVEPNFDYTIALSYIDVC